MSLFELCKELNNWFDRGFPKWIGNISIDGNVITYKGDYLHRADDIQLQAGQYFRIVGSVFNDGIFRFPTTSLQNEVFDGAVWAMAVPPAVVRLSEEIDEWIALYGRVNSAAMSPFQSESFGGYSYNKGSVSKSSDGSGAYNPNSWQSVFADRMKLWRKA